MLSTNSIGNMRRGWRFSCNAWWAIDKQQKTLCRRHLRKYGLGQMGFIRSAGLCAPTFSASGGRARRNGGGNKVHAMPAQKVRQSRARQKRPRRLMMLSSGYRRSSGPCYGCGKWKGNPTPSSRKRLKSLWERLGRGCLPRGKRCEKSGKARDRSQRRGYEVRRSGRVCLCAVRRSNDSSSGCPAHWRV